MIIIPAVDIKAGRCVRLLQGRKDSETVFSDDPSAMALRWEEEGAERLHVVDLDGAFEKSPRNMEAIAQLVERVHVPVQLGGGIRSMETISRYLDLGIDQVIIGTEAIKNPQLVEEGCRVFPGRLMVGIDARDGMVAIEGWTETTKKEAIQMARQFEGYGIAGIVFTDIHKDGMQAGPNIEETRRLAEAVSVPVIASGGVSNLHDIEVLATLESSGVVGVITGRALYENTLKLPEALALTRAKQSH
jgi:phosphoribosylformimino-5-aminoimidazole carboxamide ribotide isomerase